jgi:hypothetical protein
MMMGASGGPSALPEVALALPGSEMADALAQEGKGSHVPIQWFLLDPVVVGSEHQGQDQSPSGHEKNWFSFHIADMQTSRSSGECSRSGTLSSSFSSGPSSPEGSNRDKQRTTLIHSSCNPQKRVCLRTLRDILDLWMTH